MEKMNPAHHKMRSITKILQLQLTIAEIVKKKYFNSCMYLFFRSHKTITVVNWTKFHDTVIKHKK